MQGSFRGWQGPEINVLSKTSCWFSHDHTKVLPNTCLRPSWQPKMSAIPDYLDYYFLKKGNTGFYIAVWNKGVGDEIENPWKIKCLGSLRLSRLHFFLFTDWEQKILCENSGVESMMQIMLSVDLTVLMKHNFLKCLLVNWPSSKLLNIKRQN